MELASCWVQTACQSPSQNAARVMEDSSTPHQSDHEARQEAYAKAQACEAAADHAGALELLEPWAAELNGPGTAGLQLLASPGHRCSRQRLQVRRLHTGDLSSLDRLFCHVTLALASAVSATGAMALVRWPVCVRQLSTCCGWLVFSRFAAR